MKAGTSVVLNNESQITGAPKIAFQTLDRIQGDFTLLKQPTPSPNARKRVIYPTSKAKQLVFHNEGGDQSDLVCPNETISSPPSRLSQTDDLSLC